MRSEASLGIRIVFLICRSLQADIRLIGAVLLEASDEWQMQCRHMDVEAMGEMLSPPPTNETLQLPPKAT